LDPWKKPAFAVVSMQSSTTLQDIYAERELIRGLSDEAEVAVLLLETLESVAEFSW
jgi:hypothetical protein